MKNFLKKYKIIIGVLLLVALIFIGLRLKTNERQDDIVKIGFIGPLSETNANIGEGIKNAIEMAREKINGEKAAKTKIEVVYERLQIFVFKNNQ